MALSRGWLEVTGTVGSFVATILRIIISGRSSQWLKLFVSIHAFVGNM